MILNFAVVCCLEAFTTAEQKSTGRVNEPKTCCYPLLALNTGTLESSRMCKCRSESVTFCLFLAINTLY